MDHSRGALDHAVGDAWHDDFRKGHTALFWFGIIFLVVWIVGALMVPTPAVAAAESRKRLQ
jgi:hypothetical protein